MICQSVRKSLVSGSPWQDSLPSLSPVFNQLPVFSFSFSSVSPTKHEAQKFYFGLLFIFYQTSFHLSSRAELALFQLREKELPKSIKVNWTGKKVQKERYLASLLNYTLTHTKYSNSDEQPKKWWQLLLSDCSVLMRWNGCTEGKKEERESWLLKNKLWQTGRTKKKKRKGEKRERKWWKRSHTDTAEFN